jgi:hypothetical protein
MQQAIADKPIAGIVPREQLERIADGLAVALAISLPWSSSATGILAGLWFVAVLPTLGTTRWRDIVWSYAGALPIAFTLLALFGVLWSPAAVGERFASVVPFARMLAIPVLMCQFARSPRGIYVLYGLIASCAALMVASFWSYAEAWYPLHAKMPGVPVKDYIVQSGLFTICTFALVEFAIMRWVQQRRRSAITLMLLATVFLANIVLIATGRTAVLVMGPLLVLLALRRSTWTGRGTVLLAGLAVAAVAWNTSPYLRHRVTSVSTEVVEYQTKHAETSSGKRLEMYLWSIKLIAQAPLVGYGTGALVVTFKDATSGEGSIIMHSDNPHNQTFAVGIQLGFVGVALLYAMWLFHFLQFRGGDWAAWFGAVVVAQSAAGSLVNSYLFDFTPGWTYAVCIGVAGGMMLRQSPVPSDQQRIV